MPTGLVKDLEPWAADINFNNFNERFTQAFSYQGKRYAVPFMWDSNVLFYNKAHFDRAGVAYPNENWTWDDFYDAARRLTIREGGNTVQYGVLVHPNFQSGVGPFIFQNGQTVLNADRTRSILDNPATRDTIQRQLDMINGGYAPTMQVIAESTELALFSSGVVSMLTAHSIRVSHFADGLGRNLGVAHLPQQQRRATIFHNIAHAASARTRNEEGTRQLIAFMASRRLAEIISTTFAPCFTGMSDRFFAEYAWAGAGIIPSTIDYAFPLVVAARNSGAVGTLMGNELTRIYTNAGQLGNQLAEFDRIINAEIAR
jgi:multiple sugar transport system substrate-binding protein